MKLKMKFICVDSQINQTMILFGIVLGLGIGVAGLVAESLVAHPLVVLRRTCQVGFPSIKKTHPKLNNLYLRPSDRNESIGSYYMIK